MYIESKPSINKQINGLRMIFCFLILIYHFFFHYNGFESQGFVPNINIIWGGFFLISGLFFKCNDKKSYWKSKFEKTIIPYWISVLLIFAICFVFQKYRVGFVDLIGNLLIFPKLAFFNYVDGSHWFIVLLVYFYLVYFVFAVIGGFFQQKAEHVKHLLLIIYVLISCFGIFVESPNIVLKIIRVLFDSRLSFLIFGIFLSQICKKRFETVNWVGLSISYTCVNLWFFKIGGVANIIYFTVIVAIVVLCFLSKIRFIGHFSFGKISQQTLFIYLLHQKIGFIIIDLFANKWVGASVALLSTAILGIVIGLLYSKLLIAVKQRASFSESTNIRIGALVSYITLFANILIHIFFTPYYLNKVGDSNYGLWSFVTSITSWFTIAVFALNDSYIRFATEERKNNGEESKTNTIYFKLLVIFSVAILFVSLSILALLWSGIIPLTKYSQAEKNTILILYCISSIQIIATTILALFRLNNELNNNFVLVKTAVLTQTISIAVLSFVSLAIQPSVVIVASIGAICNILTLMVFLLVSKFKLKMQFSRERLKDNKSLLGSIFSFSSFLLLATIVSEINYAVDKTLLGFFAGGAMVTLYTLGMTFNTYCGELALSLNSVFIPKINKMALSGEKQELNEFFLSISKFQSMLVFLAVGGFAAAGKNFVLGWLGETRIQVYYIALVLLLLSSVFYCGYSSTTIQRAYSKHRVPALIILIVTIANTIISIILLILLPEEYSIVACLIGTAVSSIVGNWIIVPLYNKRTIGLPIGRFFLTIIVPMFCAALFGFAGSFLITNFLIHTEIIDSYWIRFFIDGVIFVILYGAIVVPLNWKNIKRAFGK